MRSLDTRRIGRRIKTRRLASQQRHGWRRYFNRQRGEAEMFIAMNRFRVKKGSEQAFEKVWLGRDSQLNKVPGFVEFHLLKGPEHDDLTLYASHTVRQNESAFEAVTTPRVSPGLEVASRDGIREIAAEAREAPLRRRYPLNLLPLRGDNRRDRRRYWVRRDRRRSSCASRAFAHQGRPGEHSASEGCLRLNSPRPAVRTACAFLPSRR